MFSLNNVFRPLQITWMFQILQNIKDFAANFPPRRGNEI